MSLVCNGCGETPKSGVKINMSFAPTKSSTWSTFSNLSLIQHWKADL
jgi:hypothetical protein